MTPSTIRSFRHLLLAGLIGGIAEIVWIALYTQFSDLSAVDVSRQVASTVVPGLVGSVLAPALGLMVHMVLSVLLIVLLVRAFGIFAWSPMNRERGPALTIAATAGALALVWVINFFVALPLLNPAFVSLMPYPVTFFSKLLFGLAAGWSLHYFNPQLAPQRATIRLLTSTGR